MKRTFPLIYLMILLLTPILTPVTTEAATINVPTTENPTIHRIDAKDDIITGTKFYIPHVAVGSGWNTEITVLNTTSSSAVATLSAYNASGQLIDSMLPITINANGRFQMDAGSMFVDSEDITYMVLTSEVFGLNGYGKVYKESRGSLFKAAYPKTVNHCCKIELDGWTAVILINTASVPAHITLEAYSDSGVIVALQVLDLGPGMKFSGLVETLFSPQSIDNASHLSCKSAPGIVAHFFTSFDFNQCPIIEDAEGNKFLDGPLIIENNGLLTIH